MKFPKITIKIKTDLDEEKIIKRVSKLFSDKRIRYSVKENKIHSLRIPFFRDFVDPYQRNSWSFSSNVIDSFLHISYCNVNINGCEEKRNVTVECGLKRSVLFTIVPGIVVFSLFLIFGVDLYLNLKEILAVFVHILAGFLFYNFVWIRFHIEREFAKYLKK